ncbi:MAG: HAMP domain-containing sensor histidine kinase [Lachnospiraceae bacterium]|nr:HAMP domain-containing sensor histidine kinase [Lachnospiraceae bacterium]
MKFSLKIFLTTIALVCGTLSIGGMLLLSSWLQLSLEREIEFAENQNTMLCGSLQTAAALLHPQEYGEATQMVKRILLAVQPQGRAQIPVRVSGAEGESVYETDDFPSDGAAFAGVTQQQSGYVILNRKSGYDLHYLSHWQMGSEVYALETVHDISFVFETRDRQYLSFARLTVLLVFLIGVLVFFLSRWLTKPISDLSNATKQMSGGNYSIRAAVRQRDEIGGLAQDFNHMAQALEHKIEELEDALRRQEEFSGSFAHEVKTPLTSIMGYADLLRSRELPQETRFLAANNIFKESRRLESLSFRLLELIVLKEGELQVEPVFARVFLTELANFSRLSMKEQEIELRTELEDAVLYVDATLFRTLFLNLLTNAQNAMEGGGSILLSGRWEQGTYRIAVSDTGRGISQTDLQRITDAFYRVDKARAREKGGAGLGLALCKRIVEAHSGTLSITSRPGCGTTVTVTMGGERCEK